MGVFKFLKFKKLKLNLLTQNYYLTAPYTGAGLHPFFGHFLETFSKNGKIRGIFLNEENWGFLGGFLRDVGTSWKAHFSRGNISSPRGVL